MIEIKQDNIAKWRVNEYTFSDPQMGIRTITLTVNHPFDWVDGEPVEIADFKDSYVEYDGEQFYITNSKPTAEKDTSSLSYKYTLSFEAGESDFKRRKIRNLAEVGVDNFISQGTSFSLYADITQFVQLLNNNLQYYFGSKWDIVLSAPASDSVMLTINNMFIWDLLIKTYEYYGVRWYIRGNTLYIGQEPEIIDHVFDYGVDGGLVKITRTAQAEQTVNRLIGTGGSRNVPTNYFTNRYSNFPPDPDPISGDVNIKNIMPKVFRDSVKAGTLPYIDYVEDSSLVASDGVKEDALEPNEDIFPSIAGVEVPGLGRIDQIIAVETVAVDDPDQAGYKQTFDIWVKDIQFDLSDDQYTSTVDAKISFTSGYLTGYEFVILAENGKRKVVVDTSKSHNGVSSRYKITLIKSSEELEASGKMLPSVNVNAAPGDSFVIYDINMPQSYVELAEERVQTWLESKLDELKQEKPTYTIEPLDQFFEDDAPEIDGKTIRDKLKSGNKLKINNAKITNGVQELHINQVTIQYGAVLPKYTFVVTDKVNVQGGAVQRLQSQINDIFNENKSLKGDTQSLYQKAKELDEVKRRLNNMTVGSVNLLRNTGFLGDFKSMYVDALKTVLEDTPVFTNPFDHWTHEGCEIVDTPSKSGKGVKIGSIQQNTPTLEAGKEYTISFVAKGTHVDLSIIGEMSIPLSSQFNQYSFTFTAFETKSYIFSLSGDAEVYNIQLENGNIRTDYTFSPFDDLKAISQLQAINTITSVIKEYDTATLGGLILTSMIQLGKYKNGVMEKVNAGISGIYNSDDDPSYWSGGSMEQAIRTVQRLKSNPYNVSEEEWEDLANIVFTHGGDGFFKGIIYALGGIFRGRIETSVSGNRIIIDPSEKSLNMYNSQNQKVLSMDFSEHPMGFSDARINVYAYDEEGNVLSNTQVLPSNVSVMSTSVVEGTLIHDHTSLSLGQIQMWGYSDDGATYTERYRFEVSRNTIAEGMSLEIKTTGMATTGDDLAPGMWYVDNGTIKIKQ